MAIDDWYRTQTWFLVGYFAGNNSPDEFLPAATLESAIVDGEYLRITSWLVVDIPLLIGFKHPRYPRCGRHPTIFFGFRPCVWWFLGFRYPVIPTFVAFRCQVILVERTVSQVEENSHRFCMFFCYLFSKAIHLAKADLVFCEDVSVWLVVTGTCFFSFFPISWEIHHPKWRTLIFFRGIGMPPTSLYYWLFGCPP